MPKNALRLIEDRFAALDAGDFSALYASYHPRAPFLQQFPRLEDYLVFAEQALGQLSVVKTYLGDSRPVEDGYEVICGLVFELDRQRQVLFELALLIETSDGWAYHSAQKLTAEDFPGRFEQLEFAHFDAQATKIRF